MPKPIEEFAESHAGQWDFDPQIKHFFSDGLYSKEINIPAGHAVLSHKHDYAHLSFLAKGKVWVITDDGTGNREIIDTSDDNVNKTEYTAPACVNIMANLNHAIVALEDATWYCTHKTDETDPDKVDQVLIKKGE